MDKLFEQIKEFAHTDWIAAWIGAAAILLVTALISRLVSKAMRKVMHFNEANELPSTTIFVNIARAVIWFLGICIMLATCFNVNVSGAITAMGVGGIAISLGCQSMLANLFSGLQLSLLKIIKPGDNIKVGNNSGVVRDTNWRHTIIINDSGEEVVVPNSTLSTTAFIRLLPANDATVTFAVTTNGQHLDEVAPAIEAVALQAASKAGKVIHKPVVGFTSISDEGVEGYVEFRMADERTVDDAVDKVIRAIAPLTRDPNEPAAAQAALAQAQQQAAEQQQSLADQHAREKERQQKQAEALGVPAAAQSAPASGSALSWWKRVRAHHLQRKNRSHHRSNNDQ